MKKLQLIFALICSIWAFSQSHFTTKWKVSAGSGNEEIKFYASTSTKGATDQIIYQKSDGSLVTLTENFEGTTATSPKLVTLLIPQSSVETTVNIQVPNIITFKLNSLISYNETVPVTKDVNVTSEKLIDVTQWGTSAWESFVYAFANTENLKNITANDTPNTSYLKSLSYGTDRLARMFAESGIETIKNINNWDVLGIRSFQSMFEYARSFNDDISNWKITTDTNSTVRMDKMFRYAQKFNYPLGNWSVSRVVDVYAFLHGARKYNHPLPSFTNITSLDSFLFENYSLNQDLNNINFGRLTSATQATRYTFNRSPLKNTILLEKIISDKEISGVNFSITSYSYIFPDVFVMRDPNNIYTSQNSYVRPLLITTGGSQNIHYRNTYTYNSKFSIGTIYPIATSAMSSTTDAQNYYTSQNIGVLKKQTLINGKIIEAEEYIQDQPYQEIVNLGTNYSTLPNALKLNDQKDVTLYSKSLYSLQDKTTNYIVNTNQYNVGSKSVVYKKDTTTPQDVSVDGTIVYDFTDNHLYVSKNGIWHRADN